MTSQRHVDEMRRNLGVRIAIFSRYKGCQGNFEGQINTEYFLL